MCVCLREGVCLGVCVCVSKQCINTERQDSNAYQYVCIVGAR